MLAFFFFFRTILAEGSSDNATNPPSSTHASKHMRSSKHGSRESESAWESINYSEATSQQNPRSLDLPVFPVDKKRIKDPANDDSSSLVSRIPLSDDDILAVGGVVAVQARYVPKTADSTDWLRSIKSEDWNGEANLLVNALRAADRFEVNHDELMSFLNGSDLLGWPEGLRNWIGDELMTALRQDMPASAFGDLKSVAENPTAPAAMRDYSVQHISHLVTSGVLGQEGTAYIWQTLAKNDPQTLGTALISLHRLMEQVPDLVSVEEVRSAAERLNGSSDERTRITAGAILKEVGGR